MQPDQSPALAWLIALGNVVGWKAGLDQATVIRLTAAMVAEEFPPAVFCRPSLNFVARRCEFFPTFKALCDHLGLWWRDHRPDKPARIGADDAAAVAARHQQAQHDEWQDEAAVRRSLQTVRDILASGGAAVGMSAARALHAALTRHAPQHVHLVDDVLAEHAGSPVSTATYAAPVRSVAEQLAALKEGGQ